jgi:hypothetical protein
VRSITKRRAALDRPLGMWPYRFLRLGWTLLLGAWGWSIQLRPLERGWFVQNVNLAIHEAGHIVFMPLGEFMHFLGGSLFQCLVPLAFLVYFLRRGDHHAATVALWWEATNLWYVAVYIDDAQKIALDYVGGGEHDWAYLLSEVGKVHASADIAARVHAVGTFLLVVATLLGVAADVAEPVPEPA